MIYISSAGFFLPDKPNHSGLLLIMASGSMLSTIPSILLSIFAISVIGTSATNPLILVSIDGLGWQIIEDKLIGTPNLDYIARTGVKSKHIRTVTPTLTWPNHHTYMTGLYPESHGIVSNVFYDPLYKEWFIYESDCSNFDPKFYNDSEPIWLTLQRQNGTSGVYFWPGSGGYKTQPTFFAKPICNGNCKSKINKDETTTKLSDSPQCTYNYSEPWHSRIEQVVQWLTSEDPPRFVAMYFEEPDLKGHKFGVFSREYLHEIELIDKEVVGYLLKRLRHFKLLDEVNLLIVTDHGFANVSEASQIYLDDYIDPSLYVLSQAGTAAHIWPFDEDKYEQIYEALTRINKNLHVKVYKKDDIPDVLHWKNNRRIPPIFLDPDLGWQVLSSAPGGFPSSTGVYGAHGWTSVHREMWSIFFARGPAFLEGVEIREFDTVDLYPLMCRLLAINPRPNNGSMEHVREMLKETSSGHGGISVFLNIGLVLTLSFTCSY